MNYQWTIPLQHFFILVIVVNLQPIACTVNIQFRFHVMFCSCFTCLSSWKVSSHVFPHISFLLHFITARMTYIFKNSHYEFVVNFLTMGLVGYIFSFVIFEKKLINFSNEVHSCSTFGLVVFFNVFERSLLCSPKLHLFDQEYSKTVILWNIITI